MIKAIQHFGFARGVQYTYVHRIRISPRLSMRDALPRRHWCQGQNFELKIVPLFV